MRDREFLQALQARVQGIKAQVLAEFGQGLDADALNRKFAPDLWSIAECLDHLLVSEAAYAPAFDQISRGEFKMSTWERYSPFSRFFGRLLLKSVTEDSNTRMKAPRLFLPATSAINVDIVERFVQHEEEFQKLMDRLGTVDLDATIITSPPLHVITFSLRDALTLLVQHQARHVNQAVRAKAVML